MKKLIYITLLAGMFGGCSDFLNPTPQGELSEDLFFEEKEGESMAVNAMYARLREWDQEGFPWFVITELPSDNSNSGSELSDGSTARLNTVNNFTYDASLPELDNWWVGNYNGIGDCNLVLDHFGEFSNQSQYIRSVAQAHFFRGFFYFNLVRAFGGVPLMLTIPQPGEYNKPRATVEQVYDVIVKDLAYAAENLPTRQQWGTESLGRVTKGTAEGLLAKVYLFRQDYDNAFRYADSVITRGEYDLHPDYRDLFNPHSFYSDEVMLGDQFYWLSNRDNESEFVKWQGIRGFFGWGFLSPTESLANSYETGDPRREATIFFNGDVVEGYQPIEFLPTTDPRANKKVIWPVSYWNANSFTKTDAHLYFLRYADVLLIYAEAANELGKTDEALAKLETVRLRARNSVAAGTGNTGILPQITERNKERLRLLIWKERRIELALEGHRFFDLIRADKVVPGYALEQLKADMPTTNFSASRNSVFLIPQTQIDISDGVLQPN